MAGERLPEWLLVYACPSTQVTLWSHPPSPQTVLGKRDDALLDDGKVQAQARWCI